MPALRVARRCERTFPKFRRETLRHRGRHAREKRDGVRTRSASAARKYRYISHDNLIFQLMPFTFPASEIALTRRIGYIEINAVASDGSRPFRNRQIESTCCFPVKFIASLFAPLERREAVIIGDVSGTKVSMLLFLNGRRSAEAGLNAGRCKRIPSMI